MYRNLQGKTVYITGASSGIGAACARVFAAAECNVILTARRTNRIEALKTELEQIHPKVRIHAMTLDVTTKEQINQSVTNLPEDLQQVDVLINNAGVCNGDDLLVDISTVNIDTMIDTNIKGVVYMCQTFIPHMKRQSEGGMIINMSSIGAHQVAPRVSIYSATKHAVDAITSTLRYELADSHVRITAISPGYVDTEFSDALFSGDQKKADAFYRGIQQLQAKDVAEVALFTASRPPHVELANIVVMAKGQAHATYAHRHEE
ncbi:hypothetical protein IWQ60_011051 [Tieghemiomyces parasiticus]|uniref:Oxidoreductase n=1 Tax=Tieghemiomyces parasiticus TaxID=78921 RepID=A0A9W7ZSU0_9FUNG|nr:hypothetical protein IWQ60_011051 [Tieghemiomyces parasiticus]